MTSYKGHAISAEQGTAIVELQRQGVDLRDVPVQSAPGGLVYTMPNGKLAGIGSNGDTFGFPAAQAETSAATTSNATPAAAPSAPARQPWQLTQAEQNDFTKAEAAHNAAVAAGRRGYEVVSDAADAAA